MSVSKQAKCEIIKKYSFSQDTEYLARGFVMTAGSLIISEGKLSLSLQSEFSEVADFFELVLKKLFKDASISKVREVSSLRGKERFTLLLDGGGQEVLVSLGFLVQGTNGEIAARSSPVELEQMSQAQKKAFLIGAFLGSGQLSVPSNETGKKSYGYHFEIDVNSKPQADMLAQIMSEFDIFAKIVSRGEQFIVYLKNCDTICDTLALLGSSKVMMDTMSQRVSRDKNSQTNRQINCISANIDKTVNAALKQLASIETIRSTIGIENLPEPLLEAVLSRLANPEGSLSDLLKTLDSKITKGALAQRFDKINKIAEELGDEKD